MRGPASVQACVRLIAIFVSVQRESLRILLQSWFRRSAQWGFWSLNRLIQTELFFKNKARRAAGRKGASKENEPDHVTRLFGTAQPADIPESLTLCCQRTMFGPLIQPGYKLV